MTRRGANRWRRLLDHIRRGDIDRTRVVTYRLPLEQAPQGFELLKNKQDDCEKVVLKP